MEAPVGVKVHPFRPGSFIGLHHSTSAVNLSMNGLTWSNHAWPVSGTPCQVCGGTEKLTAISMPPGVRAAAFALSIRSWICAR
jgi:hypothetical protein